MRRAVARAVPLGRVGLAVVMQLDDLGGGEEPGGLGANRCMSTAPIAKFGATITLDSAPVGRAARISSRSSARRPGGADDHVRRRARCPAHVRPAPTSGCVKSTATSASASASSCSSSVTRRRAREPISGRSARPRASGRRRPRASGRGRRRPPGRPCGPSGRRRR